MTFLRTALNSQKKLRNEPELNAAEFLKLVKQQAKLLRNFRSIHRTLGALLFVFFFVVSITALLLGWKKNSGNLILPSTKMGTTTTINNWLPMEQLQDIAFNVLRDSVSSSINLDLDRIDSRPSKGVVKFVFKEHYWGVQLDGATGKVLSVSPRRADVIENIHDGSILDVVFKTNSNILKLIYSSVMSISLLLFTVTGFWLWYGPKRMRKSKRTP
jgi:hypothetical protein